MLEVEKALEQFGRGVVKNARANLTRQGKRASNSLYRSLDWDLDVTKNGFYLTFKSTDYADFVDRGVKGATNNKYPNAHFQFGTGSHRGSGEKFKRNIESWIKTKRLFLRDEKGRFKKGGIKSLSFLIRRSIYNKGLRPSLYFTKAFENKFKRLPQDLIEAYQLDVSDFIDYTFQTKN